MRAIRGKPENLQSKTGWEEIFKSPTRFNSIKSFRQGLNEKMMEGDLEYVKTIQESPIILINPCKPLHLERMYKYNLLLCPKRPNKKNEYRKDLKIRNNLTTGQGMPIFSAHNIYKHYLNLE